MEDDGLHSEESSDTELEALACAGELHDVLEHGDVLNDGLPAFFKRMEEYTQDFFAHLDIKGWGVLTGAYVWWLDDQSVLIFGVNEAEELVTAVLPPGSEFNPLPYHEGYAFSVH